MGPGETPFSLRAIPFEPVWWGLAADAALFGLAWGAVISDYDLSGLAPGAACPECGREPHRPAVPPDRP